jgi:hypothetical protein
VAGVGARTRARAPGSGRLPAIDGQGFLIELPAVAHDPELKRMTDGSNLAFSLANDQPG